MAKKTDIRICVLHRGWVLVGEYSKDGDYTTLNNCAVIRRWGSDKGLGQIAIEGPREGTILDPEPENTFHFSQIIRTIKCEEVNKWLKALKR